MLGSLRVHSSRVSSPKSLVRPRSALLNEETSNGKTPSKPGDGNPPAKKRRLGVEDLIAREELDSEETWDWEVNDRFDVIGHLGDGTYGIVYKAIDRDRRNEVVAVKKITFQLDSDDLIPVGVVREIANLKYLQRNSFDVPIIRFVPSLSVLYFYSAHKLHSQHS